MIAWVLRLLLLCALPIIAEAGMRPHPRLTEVSRFRLEVVSFFAVAILAFSGVVQLVWNSLAKDFARMPRLSYCKALGVVTLWGLLFVIVLAMISGARELMTPGAWARRDDGGYRLAEPESTHLEHARKQRLEGLRDALWTYAKAHGGKFPAHELVGGIPEGVWKTTHPSGITFLYVPGSSADSGSRVVAYEPGVYGQNRMALFSDGTIATKRLEEIRERVNAEAK